MRSFDPRAVGSLECRAWETYYRRKWAAFLLASVGLVRAAFRMNWARTLVGAWLVLRANQKWAPVPDNDPDAARAFMAGFYRLLRASEHATFDPARAAELEVEWWRAHREAQYGAEGGRRDADRRAHRPLCVLLRRRCRRRARRPRRCGRRRWTSPTAGSRPAATPRIRSSPRSDELLVRSYAALLAAVHRVY